MVKLNCWEYKKCGRELGGSKVNELGICPAAVETRVTGLNCGKNAGRVCWAVAGTLCGGRIQGLFACKIGSCVNCEFHKIVIKEEPSNFAHTEDVLLKLKNN